MTARGQDSSSSAEVVTGYGAENTDAFARTILAPAIESMNSVYTGREIFGSSFGVGHRPAVVVIDFAYGWTDPHYRTGSSRLDGAVEATAQLIDVARAAGLPIFYTTFPWYAGPDTSRMQDFSTDVGDWDARACEIDHRVAPTPSDHVLAKASASAFFGTSLISLLIQRSVDTILITGCSTSACVRATAMDARSYRFHTAIVRECVGDRSAIAHEFTLADIQARFADVISLDEARTYAHSHRSDNVTHGIAPEGASHVK